MVVIGLVGEKGGGKGTFTSILREVLADKKIEKVGTSDILFDTLNLWGIPASRENLQRLSISMDTNYGRGTLTRAALKKIEDITADIIIYDSIRWNSDYQAVRSYSKNIVVYITAPPEVRFERLKLRNEKVGEAETSWEMFLAQEKTMTDEFISSLGSEADATFINTFKNRESFKKVIEGFCNTWKSKL